MVGQPNWRGWQQRMDRLVDLRFAEPVELHPYTAGGYSSEGDPDPSRPVLKTSAIFVTPGGSVVGEGGIAGGNFSTQQLQNDTWISIQEDLLGDPTIWKPGDRVYFPDNGKWYKINFIIPSATKRPTIQLLRIQVGDQ